MFRGFLVLIAAIMLALPAGAQTPSQADRAEFQRIITEQIAAFRADDGETAYGFAAPTIRRLFPTPDVFMRMVRQGYRPVYRPQSFRFGDAALDPLGRPAQRVTIVGPDGKTYDALYSMERQPDGSWRIDGCTLIEIPGVDA
jgi:hypothetical protein